MVTGDLYLCTVAGVGDLNADGFDDFAIGAPNDGTGGAVYVFHGPVSGAIDTSTASARIERAYGNPGWDVSGAGDFNADGSLDLLVGDAAEFGHAWLVYGPISGTIDLQQTWPEPPAPPLVTFYGEEDDELIGSAVAGGGDIDGDGFDDILIGAPGFDGGQPDRGVWYLWYGRGW